jgi:DNA repair photolyase
MKRFEHLRVNMSVSTDDDVVRRIFEPNAPAIAVRLSALRELKAAGIKTACCLSPLLPVSDPEEFAQALKGLGADRYGVNWFHSGRGTFSAATREEGLRRAAAIGWNLQSYRRTVARLQEVLPALLFGPRPFEPE